MITVTLFSTEEAEQLLDKVRDFDFIDGKKTAGNMARDVKFNRQAKINSSEYQEISNTIVNRIRANAPVCDRVFPKLFTPTYFNSFATGDFYGLHVDSAVMTSHYPVRTDFSYTLFLSSPDDYEGGELEIAEATQLKSIKLEPGILAVYETGSLHQVRKVTAGERICAIGWMQSWIPDPQYRSLISRLNQVFSSLDETVLHPALRLAYAEISEGLMRHGSR